MRELSFKGFLTTYVRTLSNGGAGGVYRLAQEAATTNARLREPLLLYALWTDKETVLQKCAAKYGLEAHFGDLLTSGREQIAAKLRDGTMPAEYQKVWNSYLKRRDRRKADDNSKMLMRNKILALQQEKHLSNYRIYTDLKLNPGNLNAWLKHGAGEKVSLETARQVLKYLKI